MRSIWEAFVSANAERLASASPIEVGCLAECFVASDSAFFRAGRPLANLAKVCPEAFCRFARGSLEMRNQFGPGWETGLRYYASRNEAFRRVFASAAPWDSGLVMAVHDLLDEDCRVIWRENLDLCKLLGGLVAARDVFERSFHQWVLWLWWQKLKQSLRWDPIMLAAIDESTRKSRKPIWPFGQRRRKYVERIGRVEAAVTGLLRFETAFNKMTAANELARPSSHRQWAESLKDQVAPKLAGLARLLGDLGISVGEEASC